MSTRFITREDERQIENKFDAIIKMLNRSELVIGNDEFFEQMQEKIERRTRIQREKAERQKEYESRLRAHQISCMKSFLLGFIDAQLAAHYPNIFGDMPFDNRIRIIESIASWLVDFFCEYKGDYNKRMEKCWYNRWYAKNIRRAKRKGGLKDANKNAT